MKVTVTALIENRSQDQALTAEFGLSLLVEAGERRILFDTGSSGAFVDNAQRLGVSLDPLDAVVLSHGHIDHCRGLRRLADTGALVAPLYVHRDFFTDRWWDKTDTEGYLEPTSSGLSMEYLLGRGVKLRAISQSCYQPFPGEELYLISSFRRVCRFEPLDPLDLVFAGGQFRVDDYRDEIALVIRKDEGLVVITGCAHNGPVNICTHAEKLLGAPVTAYVGGTHLAPSPIARAYATAEYVNSSSITTLAACHCTGADAYRAFEEICPAYRPFSTGMTLEL